MLRRQPHASAIEYAERRILEYQGTKIINNAQLDDIQTMMALVEHETFNVGDVTASKNNQAMWRMLDDIVWVIVAENEALDKKIKAKQHQISHVVTQNHHRDEDEAYRDKAEFEGSYHPRWCGVSAYPARR